MTACWRSGKARNDSRFEREIYEIEIGITGLVQYHVAERKKLKTVVVVCDVSEVESKPAPSKS